jgi:Uri superfamily endonuclease
MYKSYIVFFQCAPQVVQTSARAFQLEEGIYAYVGSCGLNCIARLRRHLERRGRKRWHVDYLACTPLYAVVTHIPEKDLAKKLAACRPVPGFGSSDDPAAPSHLFRCQLGEVLRYAGLTT